MARTTDLETDSWPVPDEDTLIGRGAPTAAPYYPPPAPPPDHRLGTGMLLGLMTALLVAAGIAVAWFLTHRDSKTQVTTVVVSTAHTASTATHATVAVRKIAVPHLVGLKEKKALARLQQLGVRPKEIFRPSGDPKGVVLSQKPREVTDVKKGATVTLVVDAVSTKAVSLPRLTGMSVADARVMLGKLELRSTVTQVTSDKQAGSVVDQAPKPGAKLARGSYVTLSVARAKPPQPTTTAPATTTSPAATTTAPPATTAPTPPPQPTSATMPDVTNQTEVAAAQAMSTAGLLPSLFFIPGSDPLGTVEQQAKPAGTKLAYHAHVQINISSGPGDKPKEQVPNLIGRTLQDAVSTLNGAHLRLIFVKLPVTSPSQAGKIVQQSPLGGNQAPQNAQVLVFLGAFRG
jgi:beta-lactam-binding protein with PASTA domain